MQPDPELEQWRREWQAHDPILPGIRQRVGRESRGMRRVRTVEVVNTVVLVGGSLAWAIVSRRPEIMTLAAAVCILFAIGWSISIALARGTWKPASATTAAFLDLSILRSRRRLQAVTTQCILYVVILAFDLAWLYHYRAGASLDVWTFLVSPRILPVWPVTAILAGTAVWYRRKLLREQRTLADLQRQVTDEARSS
jgi:hypothetical protein